MNIFKNTFAAGAIFILLAGGLRAVGNLHGPSPRGGNPFTANSPGQQTQEMEDFFKAKTIVFQRDWKTAVSGLESYIQKYPTGKMHAEALFWLARSQNNLSSEQKQPEDMIAFKETAVQTLDQLLTRHPGSPWKNDAAALRIEIAGELVLIGKTEYTRILDEIIENQVAGESILKLSALNTLIKLNPDAAIPILKKITRSDPDPQVRKNGVLLLGRNYNQSILDFLESMAANDTDENVRTEASYWTEQVRIRLIPVQLNYFVFTARMTDPFQLRRLPESQVKDFQLPSQRTGDKNAIKQEINRLFNTKLSWLSTQASSRGTFQLPGQDSRISHNIHDFNIQVLRDTLKKRPDRIEGQVLIKDRLTEASHYEPFVVRTGQDHLLAMRHDDRIALVALQFETQEQFTAEAQETPPKTGLVRIDPFEILSDIFGFKTRPIYNIKYSNIMGCVVTSTLNSSSIAALENDLVDFSLAKAEIPGTEGTWELAGHLLLQKKERRFLARMGTLIDPHGDTAAVAEKILVPVDDPASFSVAGSRIEEAHAQAKKPQTAATPVYHTTFIKQDHVRIQSTRKSFDFQEIEADTLDCGSARATFSVPEGAWILTGHLIWHKRYNTIVGRDARLVDQDDMLIAEGEKITIPLDRLQDFQVKKK